MHIWGNMCIGKDCDSMLYSVDIIYNRYCLSLLGAIYVVLQDNPRIFGFLWRICELLKAIVLWITNGLFLFFLVLTFLTQVLNI